MNNFDGYRVYNGCPDNTMQRRLNHESAMLRKMKRLGGTENMSCTYFPMEGFFIVF